MPYLIPHIGVCSSALQESHHLQVAPTAGPMHGCAVQLEGRVRPTCRTSGKNKPQPRGQGDDQGKGTGKGQGAPVPGQWIKQGIRALGAQLVQIRFTEEVQGGDGAHPRLYNPLQVGPVPKAAHLCPRLAQREGVYWCWTHLPPPM